MVNQLKLKTIYIFISIWHIISDSYIESWERNNANQYNMMAQQSLPMLSISMTFLHSLKSQVSVLPKLVSIIRETFFGEKVSSPNQFFYYQRNFFLVRRCPPQISFSTIRETFFGEKLFSTNQFFYYQRNYFLVRRRPPQISFSTIRETFLVKRCYH